MRATNWGSAGPGTEVAVRGAFDRRRGGGWRMAGRDGPGDARRTSAEDDLGCNSSAVTVGGGSLGGAAVAVTAGIRRCGWGGRRRGDDATPWVGMDDECIDGGGRRVSSASFVELVPWFYKFCKEIIIFNAQCLVDEVLRSTYFRSAPSTI